MAERPDLDDIGRRLADHYQSEKIAGSWTGAMYADMNALLTYCRELEAENKRLRAEADKMQFFTDKQVMLDWLR